MFNVVLANVDNFQDICYKPSWILFLLTIQIFKDDETEMVGERDFPTGEGEGGTPHMKGVDMLVVSLKLQIFGFWSHLGCSGQNAIIFILEGLV